MSLQKRGVHRYCSRRLQLENLEAREVFNAFNPLQDSDVSAFSDVSMKIPGVSDEISVATSSHSEECEQIVDASGNIICIMPPAPPRLSEAAKFAPETAQYPYSDTFKLHSLPKASKVIYLDFDGHITSGTAWNSAYSREIYTPAFSFDSSSAFSDEEHQSIQAIWERVAEEFSPFGVDVTTQDPGSAALRKFGKGDTSWGKRVCIGGSSQDWLGERAGGIAILNSFASSVDTPCFVFAQSQLNDVKYITDTISHEVGHTLGLSHDGTISENYYAGHEGDNSPGWAPVMGSGYHQSVVHWSKGQYPDANNRQDDLAIITKPSNGIGYRRDDAGNTISTARSFNDVGGQVDFAGVIERPTDFDVFKFEAGKGPLNFDLNPYLPDPNVDILAELLDSSGRVLQSNNPKDIYTYAMSASINYSITNPGTYYLRVSGVGAGDLTTGYSDYGSIGQYWVAGSFINFPKLNNLEKSTLLFTEGDAPVALSSQLDLSTNTDLVEAIVSIVGFKPEDRLSYVSQGSINGNYNPSTGKLTLTGSGTIEQFEEVLKSVRYFNAFDNPVGGSRTINLQIGDRFGNQSKLAGRPLTIITVNDQPTLDFIPNLTINEDEGTGEISLSGIGGGAGELQTLTITADSDNPDLIIDTDIVNVSPSETGKLLYRLMPNAFGKATITVTVRDDGGTSNGGVNEIVRKMIIDVVPVNDAPTFSTLRNISFPRFEPDFTIPGFAQDISAGPEDELGQKLKFELVVDKPELFSTQPTISPEGNLSFSTAAGAIGVARVSVTLQDDGGIANGGVDRSVVGIFEISVGFNHAPELANAVVPRIDYLASESLKPHGTLVGKFGSAGVTDADEGPILGGIAVIGVDTTHGKWSYSIDDGANWNDLSAASPTAARLLRARDLVKFLPDKGFLGTANLSYRAWDQSAGIAGDLVDFTAPGTLGDTSPFSGNSGVANVRVASVIYSQLEDTRTSGRKLDSWAGVTIADADVANTKRGVAIVGSGGNTPGHWDYRVGATWRPLVGMTPGDATLLRSVDSIRFVPDTHQFGEAYLIFRAWDQSSGVAGSRVNSANLVGGAGPYSLAEDAFFFRVNPVNDRPILDAFAGATLTPVLPTEVNPTGDLVSAILGATVTDPDTGTVPGLAVTAYGKTNGIWQYQLASGGVWKNMPMVGLASALLLGPTDRVRFVPSVAAVSSTLSFKAWDRTSGTAGDLANSIRGTSFSTMVGKGTVFVTTKPAIVNFAPDLTSLSVTFTPIFEDAKPVGDSVSTLLGKTFADKDPNALKGIAITGKTGAGDGVWQYSSNGVVWKPVGNVSAEHALLLRDTDRVRFLPTLNRHGNAKLSFRAWDRTRGTAGQSANLALAGNTGGTSPFGASEATATLIVTPVNDRPVLKTTPMPTLHQVTPGSTRPAGDLISSLLGTSLTDLDANSLRGIAITQASSPKGSWQYQIKGVADWINVPVLNRGNMFLLRDSDRIRFVPTSGFVGKVSLSYRGWDVSMGKSGEILSVTNAGTSVSTAIEIAYLEVKNSNTRPVLNVTPTLNLPPVVTGSTSPAGFVISSVLGSSFFDSNAATTPGIAVVGVDIKNGSWEYTINGVDWIRFGTVTPTGAIVLKGDSLIRFVPKTGFTGTTKISFKAWDQSDKALSGSSINASKSLAVSAATQIAALMVNTAPSLTIGL